ncbi:MAG: SMC-Scp complex subunit ScpB [Ignavibacteria bacterium]|nr:SMC-Scp complex subunit ScpB [Ignavibacteria bacterium]
MVSTELKNIVESLIFASEEEINSKQIKDIIDRSGLRIGVAEVEEAVNVLNDEYKTNNKSFEILKIAGGFSFATKKEYGRFIGKLIEDKQRKKLSPSALETLAIIAYKQPITRSEMEFIRGVNVDYIVNSLLEKDLITIHGRAETPGRPILYGTTKTFLKVLGLNSLEDLPKLKEINEILKNQEIEGITEADIELFNSVNYPEAGKESEGSHQLELISSDSSNEMTTIDSDGVLISEGSIEDDIEIEIPDEDNDEFFETENKAISDAGTVSDKDEAGLSKENNSRDEILEPDNSDNFSKNNEIDNNESENKD